MKSSRNLWPLAIISTFALFFCAIGAVITIAATHREDLVSSNYYEQELRFQAQIDAAALAKNSGAALACDDASRRITLILPAGQLVGKFSGSLELYRPAAPALDRIVPFQTDANGLEAIDVSRLAAGRWVVRAHWQAAGQDYFLEQKINLTGP
jgi:hypothetical protein